MADREEFQKKLAELLAKAAAQGNRMTQEELAAFFSRFFIRDFMRVRLTEGVYDIGDADRIGNRALRLRTGAEKVNRYRNRFGDHD